MASAPPEQINLFWTDKAVSIRDHITDTRCRVCATRQGHFSPPLDHTYHTLDLRIRASMSNRLWVIRS